MVSKNKRASSVLSPRQCVPLQCWRKAPPMGGTGDAGFSTLPCRGNSLHGPLNVIRPGPELLSGHLPPIDDDHSCEMSDDLIAMEHRGRWVDSRSPRRSHRH